MASYTIPEEIIGVPLFVPDAHDYFEIVSGGMPNGDDCLRVRGDISADYKAFQSAPVTSPNISANNTSWAMTVWLKMPSGTVTGSAFYNTCFLSMMNANQASSGGASSNGIFSFTCGNTNTVAFKRGVLDNTSGAYFVVASTVIRDGTWHFVSVNVPDSTQTGTMHIDNEDDPSGSDTQSNSTAPNAGLFLCIGKYSNAAGPTAYAADYQIGKIAFHDHHLDQTERSLLWESMTS